MLHTLNLYSAVVNYISIKLEEKKILRFIFVHIMGSISIF